MGLMRVGTANRHGYHGSTYVLTALHGQELAEILPYCRNLGQDDFTGEPGHWGYTE